MKLAKIEDDATFVSNEAKTSSRAFTITTPNFLGAIERS